MWRFQKFGATYRMKINACRILEVTSGDYGLLNIMLDIREHNEHSKQNFYNLRVHIIKYLYGL